MVVRGRASNILDTRHGLPFPIIGPGLVRAIARAVRQADVVQLHDVFYPTSWAGYIWARLYGKPVILTQHVAMVSHPSVLIRGIQKLVYATLGRLIFDHAQHIVVYNQTVHSFLVSKGVKETKISELKNGIDTSFFVPAPPTAKQALRRKYGLPASKPLVIIVGRLVAKKGYDSLFKARSDKYDLVFVGPGRVDRAWRVPGVHLMGSRSQAEIKDLYQACDIFVLPATGELFTLAMQEAMASSLPIITTNDGAYAGYGIDTSLLCLCEPTPAALGHHITRLVDDPTLMERMGRYSRELAIERFERRNNLACVKEIYERVSGIRPCTATTGREERSR